jgi:hypothetical protein
MQRKRHRGLGSFVVYQKVHPSSMTPKKLEFSVDTPSELAYISPFFEGRES